MIVPKPARSPPYKLTPTLEATDGRAIPASPTNGTNANIMPATSPTALFWQPGTTVRVCDLPGKSSGSCWRCLELGLVVVPSCACLVASSPDAPGAVEGPARGW